METTGASMNRPGSITYKTQLTWAGSKAATLCSGSKPPMRVTAPPEFRGEAGNWTPEELFVASVETCHLMTFLAFAARHQLQLVSYESHANGVLELLDGHYRFTRIVLFPTIVVPKSMDEKEVYALLDESHHHCLVTNSISSIVEVNPTIILR
jgi:organic hydroperoxide reductase OsmC/OhrA